MDMADSKDTISGDCERANVATSVLQQKLNELHALRDNDRIQRAAKVAREVEELAKAAGVNGELRTRVLGDRVLREVLTMGAEIDRHLHELSQPVARYSAHQHSRDVTVLHRTAGADEIIRVEATLNCSLFNLLAVANEVDLYKTWWPFFKFPITFGLIEARRCAQLSRVSQIIYGLGAIPWPIAWRDAAVLVYGSDDLDESNSVLVVIRSWRSADYPDVDVPHDPKHVRIDCHGCIRATRVPGDRVRISGLWSIDPKFKSIPPWLISFFVEKFMGYAIQALEKQAAVLKPEYDAQIPNNPHLYDYLKQRLAEAPIPDADRSTQHV